MTRGLIRRLSSTLNGKAKVQLKQRQADHPWGGYRRWSALSVWAVQDWNQLWKISSAPDNVPIVAMLFLVPFFTWLGIKQSQANDRLIQQLEADPKLAKTHHRKVEPWRPGWAREIHVWPYLVRIEFLATVIVTVILFVWSITLNAPLEEPANPNLTMNPSKAPWYFLGLQEMLVYFDPWIAGVVMPSIIMVGLMVFPYVDSNPLGQRLLHVPSASICDWDVWPGVPDVDFVDCYRHLYSGDRAGFGFGPDKPGTTMPSCSTKT